MNISPRYSHSLVKKYDGIEKGSSSLWAVRMLKAYGALPKILEHDHNLANQAFNYNAQQILEARKYRTAFYKRIIKPEDIIKALQYSPVSLEVEIFDSIYSDLDGWITMPDDEDVKVAVDHCFTVIGYDKSKKLFDIDSNWSKWGDNGLGVMPIDYLRKYFVTAFIIGGFPNQKQDKNTILLCEEKIKISEIYLLKTYVIGSFNFDCRQHYNLEIVDITNCLIGWIHYAVSNTKLELLDIFVLEEFRNQGIGSHLLNYVLKKVNIIIKGYISAHDLVDGREEIVKIFFSKNNILCHVDRSQFKDCRFRIEVLKN